LLFSSLLFSSLLFSSAAQAASEDSGRSPYYVQADLAYAAERITHDYPKATGANNTSTVSDYFRNIRAHSIHPRVSVGYDFGGWRIAADYASYRKWKESNYSKKVTEFKHQNGTKKEDKTEHQGNGSFHAASSLGLSAIYDFKLNDKFDKFKPYIGARVAYGHVKHQVHSVKKETTTTFLAPTQGATVPGKIVEGPFSKPAYHESHSI
ncbi:opacity family porin, partial [Neisseria meningitidis]|uniref:opacity family porin n=1 Tax=Neisseria meningitidis TaxID=487 RepID=UPI003F8A6124